MAKYRISCVNASNNAVLKISPGDWSIPTNCFIGNVVYTVEAVVSSCLVELTYMYNGNANYPAMKGIDFEFGTESRGDQSGRYIWVRRSEERRTQI